MASIPLLVYKDTTGLYISAIESLRGAVTVARHVMDLGELLGLAQSGIARAALIVGEPDSLGMSAIHTMQSFGVAVIILRDPGEEKAVSTETCISTLADTEELIAAVQTAVEELDSLPAPSPQEKTESQQVEAPRGLPAGEPQPAPVSKQGQLVVFWGSGGAPGRSVLATHSASYLASAGHKVCLLDADTYQPAVFAILGMTEDYSTLSQLAHLAEKGELGAAEFAQTVSTIKQGKTQFDVATGITHPERWPEIRQAAFEKILDTAKACYDFVLVDVSHLLEADEEISFEGVVPLRNGCTRVALEKADHIYALGGGDAIGIPRLVKALDQLAQSDLELAQNHQLHIWINKVRASAVGQHPEQQIEGAWARFGAERKISGCIPWMSDCLDQLLLTGQVAAEMPKNSPLLPVLEKLLSPLELEKNQPGSAPKPSQDSPAMIVQRVEVRPILKDRVSRLFARKGQKANN